MKDHNEAKGTSITANFKLRIMSYAKGTSNYWMLRKLIKAAAGHSFPQQTKLWS
jgi:hypothetical protein